MKLLRELFENFRIALESARANKLRSALATLGIIIGVFTVTMMATAITGVRTAFANSISLIGSDVLYIQRFNWGPSEEWWKVRARQRITVAQAERLAERATMVEAISYESGANGTVKYLDREARGVMVMGNVASTARIRGLTIAQGRFLSEAEVEGERPVCVLGADLAERLFPNQEAVGEWIRLNAQRYEVIGVADKMGEFLFGNLDYQVTIPITRLMSDFYRYPEITIAAKVGADKDMDEAQEELRWIMRAVRKVPPSEDDDFSINNQAALLDTFSQFTAIIGSAGLFMTGLSLFVGGIGIMNVMFVSVTERTSEIGVRKALGAKKRAILSQFLIEAALICVLGGLIALAMAWPVTIGLRRWLPTRISPSIAVLALSISAITGLIAGFLPANRAAKLKPVDALRSE